LLLFTSLHLCHHTFAPLHNTV